MKVTVTDEDSEKIVKFPTTRAVQFIDYRASKPATKVLSKLSK